MEGESHILKPDHGLVKVVGLEMVMLRLGSLSLKLVVNVLTTTSRHVHEACTKGSLFS